MSEIDWMRIAAEAFGAAAALDVHRGGQAASPLESDDHPELSGLDRIRAKHPQFTDFWAKRPGDTAATTASVDATQRGAQIGREIYEIFRDLTERPSS